MSFFSEMRAAWNQPYYNRRFVVLFNGGLMALCVGMGLSLGLGSGGKWWEVALILALFVTVGVVVGTLVFWLEALGASARELFERRRK